MLFLNSWLQFQLSHFNGNTNLEVIFSYVLFFFFFLVLPVYCYQPISLHPRAHMLSHVVPWTSARQTPLSVDFSRQEYWSGLPFPSPSYVLIASICKPLFFARTTFMIASWLFPTSPPQTMCFLREKILSMSTPSTQQYLPYWRQSVTTVPWISVWTSCFVHTAGWTKSIIWKLPQKTSFSIR